VRLNFVYFTESVSELYGQRMNIFTTLLTYDFNRDNISILVERKVSFPSFAPCFTKQNGSVFGDTVHYIALTWRQRLHNLPGFHEIRYWNSVRKVIDCKLRVNPN
jgi:hypothetical protein